MALPKLSPASSVNANILPITGTVSSVAATLPFGIYASSTDFLSGATDQVAYTYKKLGGDVLDIELTEGNIYSAYEEAVLEYSYIVNVHQSKNSLSSFLGHTTASFDQDGQIKSGDSLSGSNIELRYPKFDYGYVRRFADKTATEIGIGGTEAIYSGSITSVSSQSDYDLQNLISSSAATDTTVPYYGKVGDSRIIIRRMFYKTPAAMWRFYGYYGGFSAVGNLRTYGQYADDSTFDIVPVWQNKLQSMAYEDALNTRVSHWSYEIKDNKVRIHPTPNNNSPEKFWFNFTIESVPWSPSGSAGASVRGINNMNTLPFQNIAYQSINSIGKQWIRRFSLALAKEMLGQVRGKFASIPIPGESVNLNAADLLGQAKAEQDALREELKTTFAELTYTKLAEADGIVSDTVEKVMADIPAGIYVG
jgi:hypothetical protein|tara:strand:+ start:1532 stop:2794 length:1263 start_codon:yes stop_codon:yes gene_type:complete